MLGWACHDSVATINQGLGEFSKSRPYLDLALVKSRRCRRQQYKRVINLQIVALQRMIGPLNSLTVRFEFVQHRRFGNPAMRQESPAPERLDSQGVPLVHRVQGTRGLVHGPAKQQAATIIPIACGLNARKLECECAR